MEGVGEDGDGVQGRHEVSDVGHLRLAEGLRSTEGLVAGVVTHTGLGPVEVPVSVWVWIREISIMNSRGGNDDKWLFVG